MYRIQRLALRMGGAVAACLLGLTLGTSVRADDDLLEAILKGDTDKVKQLLAQKVDVNRRRAPPKPPPTPGPPFFKTEGQLMAEMAKANFEAHTELPLHAAIHTGRKELVPLLLEAGADPNRKLTANGKTALHLAAQRPDLQHRPFAAASQCRP